MNRIAGHGEVQVLPWQLHEWICLPYRRHQLHRMISNKIFKRDTTEQNQVPAEVFKRFEHLQTKILSSVLETEKGLSSVSSLCALQASPLLWALCQDDSVRNLYRLFLPLMANPLLQNYKSNGTVG